MSYELAVRSAREAKELAVNTSRGLRDLQQELRGNRDAEKRKEYAGRFAKHALLRLLAMPGQKDVGEIFAARYPCEALVTRSTTNPAMTTVPTWANELRRDEVVQFLVAGPSPSLAARLAGIAQSISSLTKLIYDPAPNAPSGNWIGQSEMIPVGKRVLASQSVTASKVAIITTFSGEIRRRSNPEIEATLDTVLRTGINRMVDATIIDDSAASPVRPAGLRYNIPPIAAAESMVADLQNLAADLLAKGGQFPIFLASPIQQIGIGLSGGEIDFPILSSSSIPPGLVIAVDALSLGVHVGPAMIERSDQAAVLMDDSPPASGSLTAQPVVRSLAQEDLVGLRIVAEFGWGLAGARLSWLEDAVW